MRASVGQPGLRAAGDHITRVMWSPREPACDRAKAQTELGLASPSGHIKVPAAATSEFHNPVAMGT
jgi:hypothetical protein